jgi:hypothetical protein
MFPPPIKEMTGLVVFVDLFDADTIWDVIDSNRERE